MNTLIADSGSTKTDWCVCHQNEVLQRIQPQGINPVHQSSEEIEKIIREMASQLTDAESIGSVHFYGAGCHSPKMQSAVSSALQAALLHCRLQEIRIDSDLVGAAQALCQGEAGIACILGTGSNSCEFDGEHIISNTNIQNNFIDNNCFNGNSAPSSVTVLIGTILNKNIFKNGTIAHIIQMNLQLSIPNI